MKRLGLALIAAVLASPLGASATFLLRNADEHTFVYWAASGLVSSSVLASLPLAPGGPHSVAPGERVRVELPDRHFLVGAFVPAAPTFQTVLPGGFLLAEELPSRGTVLVDRPSFAASNRGRSLSAPLQAWGLTVPSFVLDGRAGDWASVLPVAEWGESFLSGSSRWPSNWPKPRSLQVVDKEGALWLRFVWGPGAFPAQTAVSLALRRPGAFLEWPMTGADSTVWSWKEGSGASAVGRRIAGASELEGWLPWDRLSGSERRAWSAEATWSLMVTEAGSTRVYELVATALAQWP